MAINLKGLCRLGIGMVNNTLRKTYLNGARFMYTEQTLGITQYENTRFIYYNQFATIEETFRNKMNDVCESSDGIIFTEDMKAMLHLAQRKESDYELLIKMIEKYVNCKSDIRLGSYNFGPIVMRLFYFLNEPDVAFSIFNTPGLSDFFFQKTSYQVLMCLLYKHNMYNKIREVYDKILTNEKYYMLSKFCFIILAAASYKKSDPDSFKYAFECWRKLMENVENFSYRCSALTAALALKNNESNVALEILSSIKRQQHVDVKCLKILAYIQLNKLLSIIPILKSSIDQDYQSPFKHSYFIDVINVLEAKIEADNSLEAIELKHLLNTLRRQDRISDHVTLEDRLLKPLNLVKRNNGLLHPEQSPRYVTQPQESRHL